ncbi:electron transfer flavoprotein subunit alpha/FixB family protein [Aquirufa lenticrescens]|uniref:electron transfer flavoprotein subunit alpha/FixB family protein n=1 Tax=Aquirufa lenticrescens TaxID=2696560 RepID=UPI0021BC8870|nr:electron transfer flavoprotein subunit alpha/FixB family protein [Aquirufa lenticrescens]
MKKVAIIAQTKEGQLSDASKSLISFVSSFNPESILLLAIGDIKFSTVSASKSIDVVQLTEGLWTDSVSIQPLIQAVGGYSVLGIKSIQVDNLLSLLAASSSQEMISGIQQMSYSGGKFSITKSIFSGKASLSLTSETAGYFSLNRNFDFSANSSFEEQSINSVSTLSRAAGSKASIIALKPITGSIPLPDAALVVGAGRGLKDPGNWTIVEDLAKALGAATACSKPVSDLNWRPHHEHVGQTGVKISPNLYIACGISGAIQHLAGVNGSRIVVVINNDPEAPFFKHADYGIVGDVNDILPRLTKKLQTH